MVFGLCLCLALLLADDDGFAASSSRLDHHGGCSSGADPTHAPSCARSLDDVHDDLLGA